LLPPETFNLSFAGLSALDGVKIVLAAHTHPRAIFIETNVLRNSDTVFDNGLRPWLLAARRWMILLRDFARPVTLVKTYLRDGIDRTWAFLVGHSPTDVPSAASKADANAWNGLGPLWRLWWQRYLGDGRGVPVACTLSVKMAATEANGLPGATTPNALPTFPSVSASSGKFRFSFSVNFFWAARVSVLMPMTTVLC
jgi:hypothetical protein